LPQLHQRTWTLQPAVSKYSTAAESSSVDPFLGRSRDRLSHAAADDDQSYRGQLSFFSSLMESAMNCVFCKSPVAQNRFFCVPCEEKKASEIITDSQSFNREGQLLQRVVRDKYEIVGQIHADSLGSDYKSLYISKGRIDDIRVLPQSLSRNEKTVQAFHDLVKKWASFKNRYFFRPVVSGRQGKLHFSVNLYPSGVRMSEILAPGKDLPIEWALKLFDRICGLVKICHDAGLWHGNLKPSSFFVTGDGKCTIGHMSLIDPLPPELFRDQAPADVSLYAAPEQLKSQAATMQTDLYSLALFGYRLFSGINPFQTDKDINILYKNLHESVIPLLAINPEIPTPLNDIIARNLAKNPQDRAKSVGEFTEVLSKLELRHPQVSKSIESPPQDDKENLKKIIEEGRDYYSKGRFQKALESWSSSLRFDSSNFAVQKYKYFAQLRLKGGGLPSEKED
jgi:serine/threonine protein kinase